MATHGDFFSFFGQSPAPECHRPPLLAQSPESGAEAAIGAINFGSPEDWSTFPQKKQGFRSPISILNQSNEYSDNLIDIYIYVYYVIICIYIYNYIYNYIYIIIYIIIYIVIYIYPQYNPWGEKIGYHAI